MSSRSDGSPKATGRGPWLLVYEGFDPAQERLREALCTTGNGYFATRGAAPEASAGEVHYPGTYVAGLFNRLGSEVAGRWVENESMVNVPNWLPLTFRIDGGDWFDPSAVELLEYQQELDLRRGVLSRRLRFRDPGGRVTGLVQSRFTSMDDRNVAALEMTVHAIDWSGRLEIRSGIDGTVENTGIERYLELPGRHLGEVSAGSPEPGRLDLQVPTTQSGVLVALATRTRVQRDDAPLAADRALVQGGRKIAEVFQLEIATGEAVTVEKVVALHTSRDPAISEPAYAAGRTIEGAGSFAELLRRHVLRWDHLWERAELRMEQGEWARMVLNLHIFHLLQTVSEHIQDLDVGIPARGLHGEAYRGHIFWDELFIFPFLTLHLPKLSRSLLRYRHRRLPEARRLARAEGYAGALFPWQSGSDGREETQTMHLNPKSGRWLPDNSHLQRHINIAVAHNVWQYHQATGDIEFLGSHGAEILLETAKFWSSIAEFDRSRDRYVIRGVMGPDEYHDAYPGSDRPGLDNNAYTNVMVSWVLTEALRCLEELPELKRRQLIQALDLHRSERERWDDISRRLFVPFQGDRIISQFEGYAELDELDWEDYRDRYGDIHRLDRILEAEGDTPNRYKASKQADVLMLFFLLSTEELVEILARLGYEFDPSDVPRNVEYYLGRTAHGSTLSRVVHSWVLARSDRSASWQHFLEALNSDVADIQGGTTAEGIHAGAMAGTVDLLQRGYTGIEWRDDVIWFNPRLPDELRGLEQRIRFRRHWGVEMAISDGTLRVRLPPSDAPPIRIGYQGEVVELAAGETFEAPLP
jgi:alpha,alpha-trehalase